MSKGKLTNEVWHRIFNQVTKDNPDRSHDWMTESGGNSHGSECWCVMLTVKIAKEEGYDV